MPAYPFVNNDNVTIGAIGNTLVESVRNRAERGSGGFHRRGTADLAG